MLPTLNRSYSIAKGEVEPGFSFCISATNRVMSLAQQDESKSMMNCGFSQNWAEIALEHSILKVYHPPCLYHTCFVNEGEVANLYFILYMFCSLYHFHHSTHHACVLPWHLNRLHTSFVWGYEGYFRIPVFELLLLAMQNMAYMYCVRGGFLGIHMSEWWETPSLSQLHIPCSCRKDDGCFHTPGFTSTSIILCKFPRRYH